MIKQKLPLTIPSHKIKIVRGPYLGLCGPLVVRGALVGNHCSSVSSSGANTRRSVRQVSLCLLCCAGQSVMLNKDHHYDV